MRYIVLFLLLASPILAQNSKTSNSSGAALNDSSISHSAVDPAKLADIHRLFELTGAANLGAQMMDAMSKNVKPLMTKSLPAGDYREKLIDLWFERFRSKFNPDTILNMAIPVYDKHLTREDIRGLIEFYQTPLGQKAIHELPAIQTELFENGSKLGQEVGMTSMREVLAENPEIAKSLEEAAKAASPK
jgi:uncharacterized protein